MANSMTTISRRLYRSLLSNPRFPQSPMSFCTNTIPSPNDSNFEELSSTIPDTESPLEPKASDPFSRDFGQDRVFEERPLENGLDPGIYKAILVGQVGQLPIQKRLRSGRTVTLLSVGTGGISNNRRPRINEDPREYASRSVVQWHRVSIYSERLADVVLKNVEPGTIVYLEGNLESKVFTDPVTGLVRRIREVALRSNGRVVFLGKDSDMQQPGYSELRDVGYY